MIFWTVKDTDVLQLLEVAKIKLSNLGDNCKEQGTKQQEDFYMAVFMIK